MSPSAIRAFGVILLAGCSPVLREIRRGESSYDAGRYRQAYEAFHQALELTGDPTLHYSVGNALYRMRRYEEAARSFREATVAQPSACEISGREVHYSMIRPSWRRCFLVGRPNPVGSCGGA